MNDERPLRNLQVDLDELSAAMDDGSYEHRYFLDTGTGEVILVSEMSEEGEIQQPRSRPCIRLRVRRLRALSRAAATAARLVAPGRVL